MPAMQLLVGLVAQAILAPQVIQEMLEQVDRPAQVQLLVVRVVQHQQYGQEKMRALEYWVLLEIPVKPELIILSQ